MRAFNEMAASDLAMMWNLLAGYGGMVSIGQQVFRARRLRAAGEWALFGIIPS